MATNAPVTILNVDDQDAQRYVKTRDLRRVGYAVIEARSGAEALRLMEIHQPPLVLLDVQLPDISGYEVCRYLKQKWPAMMVLMTSATFTSSADRTAGLDSGADSFLVQPAEPLELAAAINALLRVRRTEDELRLLNETLEQRVRDRVVELAEANARLTVEIVQRQKAESALVQSQKMEAVGQLTGGLAHDFNNLLTAVIGNLDFIRNRTGDARIRRWADNAFKAAERGSKLTSQLLAFSRTQKLATTAVDVNALISGMRELLTQSLGAPIAINIELAPDLPPALADRNQLELAILNLAINARDAMPEGGTLTITTTSARDDSRTVQIAVADTGSGMPPEVAARAFDPFFTTKPAGKGTGLGLSQVYGIAKQSGGDVTISSEMGKGTTVALRLVEAAVDAGAEHKMDIGAIPEGHSERLLVVDDDADARSIISGALSDLGYVIAEAENAEGALAILDRFAPELLIVDFVMPGMNGAELAMAVRKLRPDLPILFVSGFADSAALEAMAGDVPLLRKPFRPAELAAAVRSVLHGRPIEGD